jgi:hypothetical protein
MIFRPSQIEDYESPIQSYKKRKNWGSKRPKYHHHTTMIKKWLKLKYKPNKTYPRR